MLVFDEIATGFGRTGTMFAADAAGVAPDIMCVGKALTGGYLSLAAVLCTAPGGGRPLRLRVRRAHARPHLHGQRRLPAPSPWPTSTCSPPATGPAQRTPHRGLGLRPTVCADCRGQAGVVDVRTIGAVGVVQLDHPVDVVKATDAAIEEGVWLRPFRDLIYTMPPYVTADDDLDRICTAIRRAAEVA